MFVQIFLLAILHTFKPNQQYSQHLHKSPASWLTYHANEVFATCLYYNQCD